MAPMHQPARLFNAVDLQKPSDTIAICEGELDAVIASQLLPSVGVPGVKAWRPHFNRLFGGYRRVLVLADNDDKKDNYHNDLVRDLDVDLEEEEEDFKLNYGSELSEDMYIYSSDDE